MLQLDNYNAALQSVYDYFGFKEDWPVYPINDRRKYWWKIRAGEVKFYDNKEAHDKNEGDHTYSEDILQNRYYPKAVYKGEEFTLIIVDTHTDGNKFLSIYDNSKNINSTDSK